jgi:hypothetical protein
MIRTSAHYLLGACMLSGLAAAGEGQLIGTGTGANCFPFGCVAAGNAGTIYQQVYSASYFTSARTITGIDFLLAIVGELRAGQYDLYLSTTPVAVNALSPTSNFDANRGPDNTLVGTFSLAGIAPAILSFSGFGFFYDPALGNLLLDIRVSGTGPPPRFEEAAYYRANIGDADGAFSRAHNFGAGFEDSGLQTQFVGVAAAVPEPGTIVLVTTGLLAIAIRRRRR